MRFNLISSFAAGVLITTTICGAVYFFGKNDVSKAAVKTTAKQATTQPSENEMKTKLTSLGYVVESQAEYNKNMEAAKTAASKGNATAAGTQKVVYRAVVRVTKGMTSIDVGRELVQAKIITNAFKFSKDVEKKGVENNLRPGTFAVDTSMSYNKVIATIFKP